MATVINNPATVARFTVFGEVARFDKRTADSMPINAQSVVRALSLLVKEGRVIHLIYRPSVCTIAQT